MFSKKMINVAGNGLGAIGKNVYKAWYLGRLAGKYKHINLKVFNDLTKPEMLANLLKFSSAHGQFDAVRSFTDNSILIGDQTLQILSEPEPAKLPWGELGIDIVVESTGRFTDANKAKAHIDAGAKKVIISAPAKNEDITLVMGVNHDKYDHDNHNVISNASCTTNALAPPVKVVNDKVGVKKGFMNTIHSYTNDQVTQDSPHKSDVHRAFAAAANIIPTDTGAAKAISLVLPELEGRLDGMSMRVPTLDVSVVYAVIETEKSTTADEINAAFEEASKNELNGIMGYLGGPLDGKVSSHFMGNPLSSMIQPKYTKVKDGTLLQFVAWYDNEIAYATRLLDLIEYMSSRP